MIQLANPRAPLSLNPQFRGSVRLDLAPSSLPLPPAMAPHSCCYMKARPHWATLLSLCRVPGGALHTTAPLSPGPPAIWTPQGLQLDVPPNNSPASFPKPTALPTTTAVNEIGNLGITRDFPFYQPPRCRPPALRSGPTRCCLSVLTEARVNEERPRLRELLCLAGVHLGPEGSGAVQQGQTAPRLSGW